MHDFYQQLARLEQERRRAVICTIISTQGSMPRKAGTKMAVLEDGSVIGTIGGGLFEKKVCEEALDAVNMPIGIPFKAETPAEIAISIVAKLIDCKNHLG